MSREAKQKGEKEDKEQKEKEERGEDGSDFWDEVENDEEGDDDDGDDADEYEEDGDGSGEEEEDGDEEGSGGGDDDEDSDDGDEGDEGGSGESGEGQEGDDAEGDGDGERQGSSDGSGGGHADGSDDDDSDTDSRGSEGVGGGGLSDTELEQELLDAFDSVIQSDTVSEDVDRIKDAIHDPANFDLDEPHGNVVERDVPNEAKFAATAVENEFKKLWAELEPGWRYGSDSGRLNVARAMHSDDMEEIFDEWEEGHEHNAGMEIVIALDASSSMHNYEGGNVAGSPILDACAAVWTIKRAVERLDAHVSVIQFAINTKTMISRHQKASPTQMVVPAHLEGNTIPWEAIKIGRFALSNSDRPNKLFVMVTDGVWMDPSFGQEDTCREYLTGMDATRLYLHIGDGGGRGANDKWTQYFHHTQRVASAAEIAPAVRLLVNTMIRNANK